MALIRPFLSLRKPKVYSSLFRVFLCSSSGEFNPTDSSMAQLVSKKLDGCINGELTQQDVLSTYSELTESGDLTSSCKVKILNTAAKTYGSKYQKYLRSSIGDFDKTLMADLIAEKASLNPSQIADVVWSLAKVGGADKNDLGHFGDLITADNAKMLTEIDIAMIIWAYGKINMSSFVLVKVKEEVMRRGIKGFFTRELAQIVWGLGRVKIIRSGVIMAAINDELMSRSIQSFKNQDICMFLWGFSEIGHNVKELFGRLKEELINSNRLSRFPGNHLSVILWSYANQGIKATELFTAIEVQLLTRRNLKLDQQSLVVISWAFARTDNRSRRLFNLIQGKIACENLKEWELQRLVRVLWSFTKVQLLSEDFFNRIVAEMDGCDFGSLSQVMLEEMVYVLENCNYQIPQKIVSEVEQELVKRVNVNVN